MRETIAVGVLCLLVGVGVVNRAHAQDEVATPDDRAPASVELSLSIEPTALLSLAALQLMGGRSGVGALGGLGGAFYPTLDVGFALNRSTYLVLGLSGTYSDTPRAAYSLAVPVGVLWYLETPRVGRVMPMLRVGASVGYGHYEEPAGPTLEWWAIAALVRAGLTWLPTRELALRAELGAHGGVSDSSGMSNSSLGVGIGLDALVGIVLRIT